MNSLRTLALAGVIAVVAGCSSSPSKPAAGSAAPPPTATAPAIINLAGNWKLNVESQFGPFEQTMTVIQTGKDLKGTMTSPQGSVDYTGTIEGSNVKLGFNVNAQGQELRIDYVGTTDGTTMNGKAVFGSFGEGTFKGAKQ